MPDRGVKKNSKDTAGSLNPTTDWEPGRLGEQIKISKSQIKISAIELTSNINGINPEKGTPDWGTNHLIHRCKMAAAFQSWSKPEVF